MICRSCNGDNPPGAKYCLYCGELLRLGGKTKSTGEPSRKKHDKLRAKRERRKAIERITDENPELAAKVLKTWLKSE